MASGPVRVLRVTLGHFLSISVPRAPSLQNGILSSLALPPQVVSPEITPGSAWLGARHGASAPEMSTIVRAGEGPGRGPRGTHGRRKWGSKARLEIFPPLPRWGWGGEGWWCPFPSPRPPPDRKLGRLGGAGWGGGHTLHSSPALRPPLIAASGESRSKLTFCTLHYAPPRVPRGRGPAPAPRRLLDWAINLRGPRPPRAAPGLCAPARGPRAPARPPGLLALIRRPAPPAPAFVRAPGGRAAALPSRTPSARPRPFGSVHLFELHNPPAAGGWGRGLAPGQGASTPTPPDRPMCEE